MSGTFTHVFADMEKEASKMDYLRMAGRGLKESLVGSHGLKGLAPVVKNPVGSAWSAYKEMHPLMKGLVGLGVASSAFGEGGPAQRAGKVVGNVLPIGLMGHGSKMPGMLGGTIAQEALGGGMFVHKGLLERAGEKVDKALGFGKKKPAANAPMFTQAPTPPGVK